MQKKTKHATGAVIHLAVRLSEDLEKFDEPQLLNVQDSNQV